MEKILVTTDQSTNSKAAIRFAAKLAMQHKAELIILHVYHLLKPFKWTEQTFLDYEAKFKKKTTTELTSFIADIFREIDELDVQYKAVLVSNVDVVDGIVDYACKQNCAYICISTRGAGALTKIFGTHTTRLISRSALPVICIPSSYKLKALKQILYASDMTDYESELTQVVAFARPLDANVDMIHVSYPYEMIYDKDLMEATLKKNANYKISLLNRERDMNNALLVDIDDAIKISKPNLLILFNHQSRSMFEKFLFPSNAEEYSFYGKIPLLTFNKRDNK